MEAPEAALPLRRALAWAVHGLTASGAVVGLVALVSVLDGRFERAAFAMLIALGIDAVDGALARAARVEEFAPGLDGRRLDDIVDYLNYVIVPALFLIGAGRLVAPAWAAVPVLASAYGFAQTEAKTADHFFLGFPSYWNVVALYVWLLAVPAATATAVVVGLAILVFVPIKYVYPSRMPVLQRTTNLAAAAWLGLVVAAVVAHGQPLGRRLAELSLLFPAYYAVLSLALATRARRRR